MNKGFKIAGKRPQNSKRGATKFIFSIYIFCRDNKSRVLFEYIPWYRRPELQKINYLSILFYDTLVGIQPRDMIKWCFYQPVDADSPIGVQRVRLKVIVDSYSGEPAS